MRGLARVRKIAVSILLLSFLLLSGGVLPSLRADGPAPSLAADFGYAVRIFLPLHEKTIMGSGFYYYDGETTYLVTARHVLFAPTEVEVKEGAAFAVPGHLMGKMKYHKRGRILRFDGVLSLADKDAMLTHPSVNEYGRQAILRLYERSQRLKLRGHTATVAGCSPEAGKSEIGLTRMLIQGLIKYHPEQDVAVIRIARGVNRGENGPPVLPALLPANVKRMDDVLTGDAALVPGYGPGEDGRQSRECTAPSFREGAVVGKDRGRGVIFLNCPAYPGESGGLVAGVDYTSGRKELKGIGVMSGGFHREDEEHSEDYAVAVAMDGVMELLKDKIQDPSLY
jgi:hypothetical protein